MAVSTIGKVDARTKTRTLKRVTDFELDHGHLYAYVITKDGSRKFNGYDTRFFIHAVEETRHDHSLKVLKPDTKMQYYVWMSMPTENESYEVIDYEYQPSGTARFPDEVGPSSGPDDAAKKYAFEEW